ncbi:unnamed protein product [Discosporangium mesarthrocarpum]
MSTSEEDVVASVEEAKRHSTCLKMLNKSLNRCPKVKFILEHLEKLGCSLPVEAITCEPCTGMEISGGWGYGDGPDGKPKPQVVLCEDKGIMTQTMVDHTLAHELIHAYDQCRIKVDWNDCLHRACSEIRASNTSGECSYGMELGRGNWHWGGQQKECVKRRAALSLSASPLCAEKAKDFVETAFPACFYDTQPYDKNPL